ncbi:MAG: helix-turn-helix domain-containing protein, partial [Duncaniella sp.]|nr:helix-turn-helix domain-containing protein [Duncaniella sp.]
LPEIATAKGLDYSELLDEIEAIVYSGTKINLNYFIDEEIDEDTQEDIFEYFKESESDNINDAYKELGSEYSEEDIRLVRIKFLSEMGN